MITDDRVHDLEFNTAPYFESLAKTGQLKSELIQLHKDYWMTSDASDEAAIFFRNGGVSYEGIKNAFDYLDSLPNDRDHKDAGGFFVRIYEDTVETWVSKYHPDVYEDVKHIF